MLGGYLLPFGSFLVIICHLASQAFFGAGVLSRGWELNIAQNASRPWAFLYWTS